MKPEKIVIGCAMIAILYLAGDNIHLRMELARQREVYESSMKSGAFYINWMKSFTNSTYYPLPHADTMESGSIHQ